MVPRSSVVQLESSALIAIERPPMKGTTEVNNERGCPIHVVGPLAHCIRSFVMRGGLPLYKTWQYVWTACYTRIPFQGA